MSDDINKGSEEPTKTVEPSGSTTTTKTYSEEEFKKVIAERDKAKEKVRLIEEAEKKALEAKAIEEGKAKEMLAAKDAELATVKAKAEAYEAMQEKLKKQALEKVPPELRHIAEKLSAEDALEFADKLSTNKVKPFTEKGAPHAEPQKFTSATEWERTLRSKGLA